MIQQQPTVGDTLTIVRHVLAPVGAVVDARPPTDSSIATLVAPPVLTREGDSVRIAYTIAVWTAGHSDLVLPGAIVVDLRGRVDTLADTHLPLDVASVLPAARSPGAIAPRAESPWLPGAERTILPFIVLVPLALALGLVALWWWRRLGPVPVTASTTAPPALNADRLATWLDAGEARLALDHVEWLARDRAELAEWRSRAAALRFAPSSDAEIAALVREGWTRLATDTPESPR